jgi:hypothetical protein
MYAIRTFDDEKGGKLVFYRKTSDGMEEAGLVRYADVGGRKWLIEVFTKRHPNVELL